MNTVAARGAAKIATPKTTSPSGRNAVEVNAVKAAVAARLAAVVAGDITVSVLCIYKRVMLKLRIMPYKMKLS